MKSLLTSLLILLDRSINFLLGGSFSETLSSRAHRMREKQHIYWGWVADAIDALFFWEPDHCRKSWESWYLSTLVTDVQGGVR